MTNRGWVTLHILWKAVPSHLFLWQTAWSEWHVIFWMTVSPLLFLWPTGSECHAIFCEGQLHHIFSYDQQMASDMAHFVKASLITSFPMTNSVWVTLHVLWGAVSSHFFLWPTASEWHSHFVKGSFITPFPLTNRQWVTLHIVWKAVSSHLSPWPTASKWHCAFSER